ncbi:MAG: hypothetical protein K2Z80_31880 [Xanthobacteraceae bacterium]|nr:hypothetical protein [Xanthobacteraceae bacterium]MBX9846416.1 hypothetical protein [Xanthobacteraceae bacterium]
MSFNGWQCSVIGDGAWLTKKPQQSVAALPAPPQTPVVPLQEAEYQARLEKTAGTVVAKIVKMKLVDLEVGALAPDDFILLHGRRDCEANHAPHRNFLTFVRFEAGNNLVEFFLGRAPVAFIAFADKGEPPEGNSRAAQLEPRGRERQQRVSKLP